MIIRQWRLFPLKTYKSSRDGKEYWEQIVVFDKQENQLVDYPIALLHVDSLSNEEDDTIYNLLIKGHEIIVKVTMEIA